jgi:hypothetical protein
MVHHSGDPEPWRNALRSHLRAHRQFRARRQRQGSARSATSAIVPASRRARRYRSKTAAAGPQPPSGASVLAIEILQLAVRHCRSHHAVKTAHAPLARPTTMARAPPRWPEIPPPPRWLRSPRAGRWQAPRPTNVRFSSDTRRLSAALRRTAGLGHLSGSSPPRLLPHTQVLR